MKKILCSAICFILSIIMTLSVVSAESADKVFKDVESGRWYTEAVDYCYQNGYMKGVNKDTFSINGNVTRAMFATILSAFDDTDKSSFGKRKVFSDVESKAWFASSVEWANEMNVASGTGSGKFSPNNAITREALFVMLYSYSKISGVNTKVSVDISGYDDSDTVSKWARDAVEWAVASGLMTGYNNKLSPKSNATRAQVAVIINAFSKLKKAELCSNFTVSRAFSDDMIVQRNEKLTVWGFAPVSENGKLIRVTFKGEIATCTVEKGQWNAVFDNTFIQSANPSDIKCYGSNKTADIKNVMVGDVYYVIGQSNVYWPINLLIEDLKINNMLDTLKYDFNDSRNIRFFRNSAVFYSGETGENTPGTAKKFDDVKSESSYCMKPSDENIQNYSAIGYLFAYNLSENIDIPIGIIEIDASGCPLTTFSPNEMCEKWHSDINYMGTGVYYMLLGGQTLPLPSRCAYNQQLYPLINFSCAGVVWYQGESDCNNTIQNYGKNVYTFQNMFVELMSYYRSHFGNSDFPVYIIEFPPCYGYYTSNYLPTGVVRSELGVIPTLLDDCYVVPSSDFWPIQYMKWDNNIHPFCKGFQASRLTKMILAKEYNMGNVDYTFGPTFEKIEYSEDGKSAVITFKYVGDGLDFEDEEDTDTITGFEIKVNGSWNVTYNVEVTSKNQVTVTSKEELQGVRYNAQTDYYAPVTCNMYNSEKIPMVAFADYR